MDALSDLLHAVKLNGALFLEARFKAPWCIQSNSGRESSGMLGGLEHIVFFHVITEGSCKVRLISGGETLEGGVGDLILMAQDDTHLLGSDLQLAPVNADSLVQPAPPGGMLSVEHGGGGKETR